MDENQNPKSTPTPSTFGMREQFTTVTPLSKFLAMILFVMLPFVGFGVGIEYQKNIESEKEAQEVPIVITQTQVVSSEITPELSEKQKCDVAAGVECVPNFRNEGCGWTPSGVGAGKFISPAFGETFISGQEKEIAWQMLTSEYFRFNFDVSLMDKTNVELGSVNQANWFRDPGPFLLTWDFKTIYGNDLKPDLTKIIESGDYKLRFSYQHQCKPNLTLYFDSDLFRIENSQ